MKEIKAKEGMYLTQNAEVGEDRVYITALIGMNINESDWRDATELEKNEWEQSHIIEEDL